MALVDLVGSGDAELRIAAEVRIADEGLDVLLDDPRVLNGVLTESNLNASPRLVFYVLIRHALLERGITDRLTADYLASLVLTFGEKNRAYRISESSPEEFHYLVDLQRLHSEGDSRDIFLVHSHIGNYALWLTGLYPDYIHERMYRRGAPPLGYYEEVGSSGFWAAARSHQAKEFGLAELFLTASRDFPVLREVLNHLADRHLWKTGGNAVERLLREVAWQVPRV
jgi:hypothetical protein